MFNSQYAKKINILYFEPSTGYGGSSRCLLEWLKNLDREKFKPLVAVYFDGPAIKKIKELGVETIKLPYFTFVKRLSLKYKDARFISYLISLIDLINIIPGLFSLIMLIKKKNVGLLHINSGITISVSPILASFLTRTPCICHIHGTWKFVKTEKILGKLVNKFIVLTNEVFKLYVSQFGKERAALIYNGINLNDYKLSENNTNRIKTEFGLNGAPVIGMVGRLTSGKGHEDFLTAAEKIRSWYPHVKFIVVGSSVFFEKKVEQSLRKMAENLGLKEDVIFTGWREDAKDIMALFDMLVFPSTTFPEGLPLTCIEAMALSKPVVATNIPGPSEIVLDNKTGFLIPPGRPDILTEKLVSLIENQELAKSMGEQARKRSEELFDIKKVTKQIENVYKELVLEKNKPSAI